MALYRITVDLHDDCIEQDADRALSVIKSIAEVAEASLEELDD